MDLGGFMEMRGNQRTIGFSNCERYFAKGTRGIHGVYPVPELTPGMPNDFLSKLFQEYNAVSAREAEKAAEDKAAYDDAMTEGYQIIATVVDADTATAALHKIKAVKHALTSEKELSVAFNSQIKALDLMWDKVLKQYTPKPKEEEK